MKHKDPMTGRKMGEDIGGHDMPNQKTAKRVQNSTSNNPAALPGKVKGTPASNKKYKHMPSAKIPKRAPRY